MDNSHFMLPLHPHQDSRHRATYRAAPFGGQVMWIETLKSIPMSQNSFSSPEGDRYGFARRFLVCSDEELIEAFNREVGKVSLANGQADYLFHLHRELVEREFDCSAIIIGRTMSLLHRITLVDNRLVV
jgi:hypothetical protein